MVTFLNPYAFLVGIILLRKDDRFSEKKTLKIGPLLAFHDLPPVHSQLHCQIWACRKFHFIYYTSML